MSTKGKVIAIVLVLLAIGLIVYGEVTGARPADFQTPTTYDVPMIYAPSRETIPEEVN